MDLADLLRTSGIDPAHVLVVRHRPWEPKLANILPWLAGHRPDLFNAYQSTQNPRAESSFRRAAYIGAFVARENNQAIFAGLFKNVGYRELSLDGFVREPGYDELVELGMMPSSEEDQREVFLRFDLQLTDVMSDWRGKLVLDWPLPARAWTRWGDRNIFKIAAVLEDTLFEPAMPDWRNIDLSWKELKVLPSSWRAAFNEWRGIYLIFDTIGGGRYVGSAYGEANILGRWENYAATGHGDNRHLRNLDPDGFQFSILERLSPDTEAEDVIRRETSWKRRLHTFFPDGLNGN